MIVEDLAGCRFGSLVAVARISPVNKHTMWLCKCDCGNEKAINASNLKRGLTKTCGGRVHRLGADLTGRRFGRLTVAKRANATGASKWICRCDCGGERTILASSLLNGSTQSCGCIQREEAAETGRRSATHGESKTRLYRIWTGIKCRVNNPNCKRYNCYGGRGIRICAEWENSFESFRDWAISTGYDPDAPYGACTIDRIDVNGDYEPNNCRWADLKTQAANKRKVVRSCSSDA